MKFSKKNYFRNLKKEQWKRLNEDAIGVVAPVEDDTAPDVIEMVPSTQFRDSGIQFEPVDDVTASSAKDTDVEYIKAVTEQIIAALESIVSKIDDIDPMASYDGFSTECDYFEQHDLVTQILNVANLVNGIENTVDDRIRMSQGTTQDEIVGGKVEQSVNGWYASVPTETEQEYPNASEIVATAPDRINSLVNGTEYTGSAENAVDFSINNWKP